MKDGTPKVSPVAGLVRDFAILFAFTTISLLLPTASWAQQSSPATPSPSIQTPSSLPTFPQQTRPSSGPSPAPTLSSAQITELMGGENIREVKPPVSIPYPYLWIIYVAGGLLILALIFGLWQWLRRKLRKQEERKAHEIAFAELEEARKYLLEGKAEPFAVAVSNATRRYIEKRFGIRATHQTTEEFLRDLLKTSSSPMSEYQHPLQDFLTYCDLGKFANGYLNTEQMNAMLQTAIDFVHATEVASSEQETNISQGASEPPQSPVTEEKEAVS